MNRLLMAMMATLVLAGCGQTGPLYMPDDQQSRDRYDPQGAYESGDAQQQESDSSGERSGAGSTSDGPGTSTGTAPQETIGVPEGDSQPDTPTGGTIGGAASTGAPAAPAASGQGGT